MPDKTAMKLTSLEKETLRHALYIFRQIVRTEDQMAQEQDTKASARDSERFQGIINRTFVIEDKLK